MVCATASTRPSRGGAGVDGADSGAIMSSITVPNVSFHE
jgi:hypothetical protein